MQNQPNLYVCQSMQGSKTCVSQKFQFKGVPPADENGDIGTSDRVGQDESVGTK